jgi:hypothetical protein
MGGVWLGRCSATLESTARFVKITVAARNYKVWLTIKCSTGEVMPISLSSAVQVAWPVVRTAGGSWSLSLPSGSLVLCLTLARALTTHDTATLIVCALHTRLPRHHTHTVALRTAMRMTH